jgi:heat shock protein HslJ
MWARAHAGVAVAAAMLVTGGMWITAQSSVPTLEQARLATYHGIYDSDITLRDGVYEGQPMTPGSASRPRVELVNGGLTIGNVGGEGRTGAAVLLAESSGGSGTNLYLALLIADGAVVRNAAPTLVGNRGQVRSLGITGGTIVMETVQAGPNEPMCCPTTKLRRTWTLEKGTLTEAKAEQQGSVSFADLDARTWTLASLNGTDPLPANVTVTAEFKRSRVSGTAGCNRYTAPVTTASSGQSFAVGQAAVTRMMCEGDRMTVERDYLKALAVATTFSFMPGNRVALAYRDGDATKSLVFVGK